MTPKKAQSGPVREFRKNHVCFPVRGVVRVFYLLSLCEWSEDSHRRGVSDRACSCLSVGVTQGCGEVWVWTRRPACRSVLGTSGCGLLRGLGREQPPGKWDRGLRVWPQTLRMPRAGGMGQGLIWEQCRPRRRSLRPVPPHCARGPRSPSRPPVGPGPHPSASSQRTHLSSRAGFTQAADPACGSGRRGLPPQRSVQPGSEPPREPLVRRPGGGRAL